MRRILAGLILTAGWAFAQQAAAPAKADIPRMPDGKPNFQGFWNIPYTPNLAANGKEADVPYTPAGLEAFRNHDSKDDPTSFCNYPGVPRIMQSPYPVQILQTPEYLIFAFEYMSMWRVIPLDGRPRPARVELTYMGNSIGHWEGDTIVVETIGLNDKTWLDTAGHQHSDQLKVIERFTRTPTSIVMNYDIIDPVMYSKPWNLERPLTPLKAVHGLPELIEYACNENNRDVEHLQSTKPAVGR
jgi:hypothetical protein